MKVSDLKDGSFYTAHIILNYSHDGKSLGDIFISKIYGSELKCLLMFGIKDYNSFWVKEHELE